jgi:uncharacterized protein
MDGVTVVRLCAAALAAGVMTPAGANATSTIALLPGSVAGMWGYRRELREVWSTAKLLLVPSLLGGLLGSVLMVAFPEDFARLVPWLILTAALLFLVQQPLSKYLRKPTEPVPPSRGKLAGLMLFQFGVATYGGYFGAGIGILMLASLGFMNIGNIHRMNAVKTFLASIINLTSVVVFVSADFTRTTPLIDWPYAGIMAIAAIIGGYLGARVARKLPAKYVRWAVIVIAFTLTAYYFAKQI